MSLHERQRQRLVKTIEWARRIEQELSDVRAAHVGEVHFRPSSTAVSMIGLRPERPQRGRSSVSNLAKLAANFGTEFRRHCVDCSQGRITPEARLQSFLVSAAYRRNREMGTLQGDDEPLLFVADELSLPFADGEIKCDVLGLRGDRPVVIELKSERAMKRLVAQVSGYSTVVEEHLDLFSELYSVILGRELHLGRPCERWIVWPKLASHPRDPREDELAEQRIRVVGFSESEDGRFSFQVGRDPLR